MMMYCRVCLCGCGRARNYRGPMSQLPLMLTGCFERVGPLA